MASAGAGLRADLVYLSEGYSVSVLLPDMLSPLSSCEWNVSDLKSNTGFVLISPDYLPASPHMCTNISCS